jgi:hypothetical protein
MSENDVAVNFRNSCISRSEISPQRHLSLHCDKSFEPSSLNGIPRPQVNGTPICLFASSPISRAVLHAPIVRCSGNLQSPMHVVPLFLLKLCK